MDAVRGAATTPQLTRFTTEKERENITGVSLNPDDVAHFLDMFKMGLTGAAQAADGAVQDDMGLSVEATVRISRPVRGGDGEITDLVSRETVTGRIQARKVYTDPALKPTVED